MIKGSKRRVHWILTSAYTQVSIGISFIFKELQREDNADFQLQVADPMSAPCVGNPSERVVHFIDILEVFTKDLVYP